MGPLLAPLNALPDEEAGRPEGVALDCEALGDGLGRLAPAEGAGREGEGVPVEGRAAAVGVVGLVPPELQPRACLLPAEVAAEGVPLLLRRL